VGEADASEIENKNGVGEADSGAGNAESR